MTTVEILTKAKELIADKSRWCQGKYWRNADGVGTCYEREAASFCADGAVMFVGGDGDVRGAIRLLEAASHECYAYGEVYVNDELGHEAVLSVYDRAIELARSE